MTAIEEVQTPALVLNLDALERNLARMAAECREAGVALRPHTKTHKSPWVARRQIDSGAVGVCAAKVGEAEVLVKSGVENVLITTELTPAKMGRALALAKLATLTVVVDDADMVHELDRQAKSARVELEVLVDVNVGQDRAGTEPGEAAAEVALIVARSPNLNFAGLQGYEGHVQHVFEYREQRKRAFECYDRLAASKAAVEAAGLAVPWVTTAGTGSYRFAIEHGLATEVQPGSYVVMDCVYKKVERTVYENALHVLSSVVTVNRPGVAVIDAGWKTLSTDGGAPVLRDHPESLYSSAGDEHGKVAGLLNARVGDLLWIVPSHCDTTINLYDSYVLVRDDGGVEGVLPVATRGMSQ